jgi:hypothetical protein
MPKYTVFKYSNKIGYTVELNSADSVPRSKGKHKYTDNGKHDKANQKKQGGGN